MKLVSLKAQPLIPWFDNLEAFREIGVFKVEDDVFVVAEYYGNSEWVNEVDPEYILQQNTPKKMAISLPELVQKDQIFTISASYHLDGEYLIYLGELPVALTITNGITEKQIAIPTSGKFIVTSNAVEVDPYKIIVSL